MRPTTSWTAAVLGMLLLGLPTTPAQPFDRRTPVVKAVEKVGPAVVNILTTRLEQRYDFSSWFDLRAPRTYKATSLGSGVIIDSIGLVVTNEHVVRGAAEIKVHLSDGRRFAARRIEQAVRSLDLALLQIANDRDESFPFIRLGRSDDIMVGETVIAIGNPFGLENSVTTGVISAKNRSIAPPLGSRVSYRNLLQTDASINPGNSGGALVNINGELIGVNTAIHARGEGIGFAIPVDAVRTSVIRLLGQEIRSRGESLGFGLSPAPGGVVVTSLARDGPAEAAGIKTGDRVRAIGRRRITNLFEYSLALYASSGRPSTRILLDRDGVTLEKEVARPRNYRERVLNYLAERRRLATRGATGESNRYIRQRIGLSGDTLDPELRRLFHLPAGLEGVVVLELERGGPADVLGLQQYDVILGFGTLVGRFRPQLAVPTVAALKDALRRLRPRRSVEIQIYRRDQELMHGPIDLR